MDNFSGLGSFLNAQKGIQLGEQQTLQNENQGLMNLYQQLQNQRYGQETPLTLQKLMEANRESKMKNDITSRTMETGIGKTNAANEASISSDKVKEGLSRNDMLIQAYTSGGKPELTRKAKELGVSQEFFDNVINTPNPGETLTQNRRQLAERLALTPEQAQSEQKEALKSVYDLKKQELANQGMIEAAKQRGADMITAKGIGAGGDKPPKTAEEGLLRQIAALEASGEITHEQAQAERAAIFNRKTDVKVQPGVTLPGGGGLIPKPQSAPYVPGQTGQPLQQQQLKQDLTNLLKQQGVPYEPDKYDYRISPEGKIQRKIK